MTTVYLITGASKGIGRATVLNALRYNNGRVVAVARNEILLNELQSTAKKMGFGEDRLLIVPGDICNKQTVSTAVQAAVAKWGKLDAVIANAGILEPVSLVENTTLEDWQTLFNVNLFSIVDLAKESLPYLRKTRGTLILVSSGAAVKGYTGWGCYGASKAALNHLGMTLGVEEQEVATLCIRPGVVDTDMQVVIRSKGREAMKDDAQKFIDLHENGQLLSPDQPGKLLAALGAHPMHERSGQFLSWDDPALESCRK
ncbi:NAD(P)-binding protein [Hesseltinella vesiculosa]|uniref:NAD(P)-binding protein n=1 Tax=Hesseltinella vesiculosa TaxID=101127 RepID=A0A1X2GLL2_9FUNG|nr:NAD(P)-binding protein [Hesseltinella vesiculosa]